jgi:uncharacterized NAD-dependent epimerase/dehydratase family protein
LRIPRTYLLSIAGSLARQKKQSSEHPNESNLKYISADARLALYAEGEFGKGRSKTAEGVMRYGQNPIAAVIDSTATGKTIKETVGIDCPAPIVASIEDSLVHKPTVLLLGTAPTGGRLPDSWRADIILAIENGLDIVSGLHDFLEDDPEIKAVADAHGRLLLDVRKAPEDLPVASGLAKKVKGFTVLTVGSDVSIGKMTTSLELLRAAQKKNVKADFVATGQTGIMVAGGKGIAIDRVIGDFMAGAAEQMVTSVDESCELIFVEGQGSLAHPGFSGVTLSLLHGSCPKAMILCHQPGRKLIGRLPDFPILDLKRMIGLNETMAALMQPAKVVGIALNTNGLNEEEARQAILAIEQETELPCTDPVRFGADALVDAILTAKNNYLESTKQLVGL